MDFFSSDIHAWHNNIIKYSGRPFNSLDEMHSTIIERHNSVVGPEDTWHFVGDFAFASIERQQYFLSCLNGKKKILYLGNHDRPVNVMLEIGFDEVYPKPVDWEYGGYKFRICHYPFAPEDHAGITPRFMDRRPSPVGCDWLICGHCFDDKTEILTDNGWKNIDSIKREDKTLSLDTSKDTLEYCSINNLIINSNQEELLEYMDKRAQINFSATPKHEMYARKIKNLKYNKIKLEDISKLNNSVFYMRTSASMFKESIPFTDNELRLITWIVTDGSLGRTSTNTIGSLRFRLKKIRKIERLSSLLKAMQIPYKYNKKQNRISVSIITIKNILNLFKTNKKFPYFFKNMNYAQSKVFLEEYSQTDGTKRSFKNIALYTSVEEHADLIQFICITNGHQCTKLSRIVPTSYCPILKESYTLNVTLDKVESGINTKDIQNKKYLGRTWCVSVSLGTVISRRNGKVVITGNCHEKWKIMRNAINVGVDSWDFYPQSIDQIIDSIKKSGYNSDPKLIKNIYCY